MNEQHCNQCGNHCPIDALRCNRGRAYFGQEATDEKTPTGPVGLLQKCGFILHHGNIDPANALSALTSQEQEELSRLLSALLADWKERMPDKLPDHHHNHHDHGKGYH